MASKATLHSILLVLCISVFVQGRILKLNSYDIDDQFLISDGVDHYHHDGSKSTTLGTINCEHQYGFLPCAENIPGYMFQIVVYQLLLDMVEGQIDTGTQELFNIIGETKVGGVIFRFLKALPSMIFLILSGAFSSKENAQSTVSVGVGIFAGITVFSLTLQWGIVLIYGRRNLKVNSNDHAGDSSCSTGREMLTILKDDCIQIDEKTRKTGGIMLLSLIPYVIVQLVSIFRSSSANHVITIVALIVSVLLLASYFLYQVTTTWMQERSLAYTMYEIVKKRFLQHIQQEGPFLTKDGKVDANAIHNLFKQFDCDFDGSISKSEVREFLSRSRIHRRPEEIVEDVFKKFDLDNDGILNKSEFEAAISTLVISGKQLRYDIWILVASLIRVILGAVIMTLLGGPLMNNILSLSYAVGFPSFSTSFVIVPITMNIRASAAAILPAKDKDENSASLTFSEIYSSVIMNNIMGLTTLLFIVYFKGLTWDFSGEVLTILFVCAIIGDGVDHHHHDGSSKSTALAATTCNHQYSFLPSAENIPGYIFLVFVYQLLLKSVEGQIDRGSKELFNIIGETKVGGIIFRFLMALPSMIFIILSGAFSSKENAQSTVRVGVGIYAGITVFSLTFHWGIILMLGSRNLKFKSNDNAQDSTSSCFPGREQLIKLKDDGVRVDEKTRKTGGIMLLSLIPYAIVQLDNIFRSSSANHAITIAALIVSVLLLASYFLYQVGVIE